MFRVIRIIFFSLILNFVFIFNAHAYLDPVTGSVIINVIIVLVTTILFYIRNPKRIFIDLKNFYKKKSAPLAEKNPFAISISLSVLSVITFPYFFVNYPFVYIYKISFYGSIIFGLIIYTLLYYIFFKYLINFKQNFFSRVLKIFFYFFIFIVILKTIVSHVGYISFPVFIKDFLGINVFSLERKILTVFTLLIIFFILYRFLNTKKINFSKLLYAYSIASLIIICFYTYFNTNRLIDSNYIKIKEKTFIDTAPKQIKKKKVVILMFDEWDADIYFGSKYNETGLKVFSNMVEYKNAISPGRDTVYSVAPFILGESGEGVLYTNRIKFGYKDKNKFVEINKKNSFFDLKNEKEIAIVGASAFNYCAYILIDNCIDKSFFLEPLKLSDFTKGLTLISSIYNYLFKTYLFDYERQKTDVKLQKKINLDLDIKRNILVNEKITKLGLKAITDKSLSLVVINFQFPHQPSFYAKKILYEDKYKNINDADLNYMLTELMVQKVINLIRTDPAKQDVLMIATSDHGVRNNLKLNSVPLYVGLKNDKKEFKINDKISTFHVSDLIGEFFSDNINNNKDIINFFKDKPVIYPQSKTRTYL